MAEQYWRRIRGNPGELPKLAILPTQLTPGNQKLWWDAFVVKKNASDKMLLDEAAAEPFSGESPDVRRRVSV